MFHILLHFLTLYCTFLTLFWSCFYFTSVFMFLTLCNIFFHYLQSFGILLNSLCTFQHSVTFFSLFFFSIFSDEIFIYFPPKLSFFSSWNTCSTFHFWEIWGSTVSIFCKCISHQNQNNLILTQIMKNNAHPKTPKQQMRKY